MIKRISIPIYGGKLVLIQVQDLKEIPSRYDPDFDTDRCSGLAYHLESSHRRCTEFIIAVTYNITAGLIAHEAYHIVIKIYQTFYMDYDTVNNEPAAHLLEWIVNQCNKYFVYNGC